MDDLLQERFLLDVEDAESLAKPYIKDVPNIDKLLVSDSFLSFGGLPVAPSLSASELDSMDLESKRTWIACRLWVICKKIRTIKNPSLQAAFELKKYSEWLRHAGMSHELAGSIGGKVKRGYSSDLDLLIKEIISNNRGAKGLTGIVFRNLVGLERGVIESIEKKEKNSSNDVDELIISWETNEASGKQIIKKGTIRKKIHQINNP